MSVHIYELKWIAPSFSIERSLPIAPRSAALVLDDQIIREAERKVNT
jgi:hypothetical protein